MKSIQKLFTIVQPFKVVMIVVMKSREAFVVFLSIALIKVLSACVRIQGYFQFYEITFWYTYRMDMMWFWKA